LAVGGRENLAALAPLSFHERRRYDSQRTAQRSESETLNMAHGSTPHFANDKGVEKILVGVKELQCMGARPPFDHPHVFLDMGGDSQVLCPYCSTLYICDARLHGDETDPSGCLVTEKL
jgi:uncharacterized Zn-finger protein